MSESFCVIWHLGTKRFDSEKAGDREVQRTMLELLNQLDGFQPNHDIKVVFKEINKHFMSLVHSYTSWFKQEVLLSRQVSACVFDLLY